MFKPSILTGYLPQKSVALLVCFAIVVGGLAYGNASDREIAWTNDLDAAFQKAAATDSIVLVHFYGDYCPPCKLLDKKTFHDPTLVSKINQKLVPVKINADQRKDLAIKYQVTRWPTDIYLFPNGEEIHRGISNADPLVYCKTIDRVAVRQQGKASELNSMLLAKDKRLDRSNAEPTANYAADQPRVAANPVHSVRTQSAAWSTTSESLPENSQATNTPSSFPSMPTNFRVPANSRVIENPFALDQPIIVPPAPSVPRKALLPDAAVPNPSSSNRMANEPVTDSVAKPVVVAQPISSPRNLDDSLPGPDANQSVAAQQVYAETIGLGGFCPVTLIESLSQPGVNGWAEGKKSFAVRHRGRVYYCATEQARRTLLNNPDRFTPCLSGFDLVHLCKAGELHDGKCEFGCIQEGTNRVFLFETKANYDEFRRNSEHYSRLLDNAAPERVANVINGTQNR